MGRYIGIPTSQLLSFYSLTSLTSTSLRRRSARGIWLIVSTLGLRGWFTLTLIMHSWLY